MLPGPATAAPLHQQPLLMMPRLAITAAALGAADGVVARSHPRAVGVVCNENHGLYIVARRAVHCLCAVCIAARRADPSGEGALVSPTEFERHSGLPSAKKWRVTWVLSRMRVLCACARMWRCQGRGHSSAFQCAALSLSLSAHPI
jgi:SAND domain